MLTTITVYDKVTVTNKCNKIKYSYPMQTEAAALDTARRRPGKDK